MKNRLKKIRKDAGVNQTDFASSIGLSRNMIAQVETDLCRLSDRSIRDICRIYQVNESWLRTGDGDPYKPRSTNQQIADFLNTVMEDVDDSIKKKLILALSRLDCDEWELIERIAADLVEKSEED